MKLYLLMKDDGFLNLTEAESMANAWITTCFEQDIDEDECEDVDIYEVGPRFEIKLNKCRDPFKFTKVKS